MEAYYVFSDESGQYDGNPSKRFIKNHPFYVRANILIAVDEYANYQKQIQALNKEYEVPPYEEIKWSDIWSRKRNRPRSEFIAGLNPEEPLEYVNQVFSLAESAESIKIVLTCSENGKSFANTDTMLRFHLQEAFQRINNELKNKGFATFIIDELSDECADQVKSVCHWLIEKGDFVKYTSLYSGVLFEKSSLSAGIQLADYTAGIFNSFLKSITASNGNYQYAKDVFHSFIKPRLRSSITGQIMGYGIREVMRDDEFRKTIGIALGGDTP